MGDRDGTRHITELCHKLGLRYIAYYWAQRERPATAQAHPDWRCASSRGKPTGYYCVNNPAYRQLVRNRVVELVRKVGVDGVFFDMFHAQGCRLVVHLVNDLSSFGRSQNVAGQSLYERREVVPIHNIRLTIRGPKPRQVLLVPGKRALAAKPVAEGVEVELPPLEIRALVVIER